MAIVSTSGLEDLFEDLESLAELPDELILDMLSAQADIVADAQRAKARAVGVFDTGTTAQSITFKKKLSIKGSNKAVYVYPQGTRNDGNRRAINEVAFINEVGADKKGIPARPFINTANEETASAQEEAALAVYDKYLKSKNL